MLMWLGRVIAATAMLIADASAQEGQRREALDKMVTCFTERALQLDDKRSDPASVARALLALCIAPREAYAKALLIGHFSLTEIDKGWPDTMRARREPDIDLAIAAVLSARAQTPATFK